MSTTQRMQSPAWKLGYAPVELTGVNDTYVHVVEAFVDFCKCAVVGDIFINLELAL